MAITQPRYAQVADVLRRRITDGVYAPGDQIPSERDLREEFEVSAPTAKAAKAQLEREGLVYSQQGRGTFVRETMQLIRFGSERYQGDGRPPNLREENASGQEIEVTADRRQVQATPEVAARLSIEPGDMCSEASYTWYANGEPVMVSTQWEPLALTRGTPIELPASGERNQLGVIGRFALIGHQVTHVIEDTYTRMPTPDESHVLKIPNGVPVLYVERTHYSSGLPVETARITMRGDKFVVHTDHVVRHDQGDTL
jgi:GntR family transcriptional regulator